MRQSLLKFKIANLGLGILCFIFGNISIQAADLENVLSCSEFKTVARFIQKQHLRFQQLQDSTSAINELLESAKTSMPTTLRLLGYPFLAAQFENYRLAAFKKINAQSLDQVCAYLETSTYRAAYLKSFARALDPYSDFYLNEELETKSSVVDGEFIGVGIGTDPKEDYLEITEVVAEGPAHVKLKPADKIYKIDGYPVSGLNEMEIRQRIRGRIGTEVKFSISRDSQMIDVTVVRDHIRQPSVSFAWMKDRVLSIKLSRFFKPTASEVETILAHEAPKARGIILDLRNNPGGLLQAARDVVDLFITQGVVVYLKGKNVEDQVWALRDGGYLNIPLVVLVNEGTASAAEIVAGALQDYGRAVVVGQKTYGKGSVQNIYETQQILNTRYKGGMKLTTLWYYLPSGRSVKSLDPDVHVMAAEGEKVIPHPQMPYRGADQIEVAQLPLFGNRLALNSKKMEKLSKTAKSSEEAGQALLLEKWADFSSAHSLDQ